MIKQINRNKMSKHEIEQHFFKKGYEYALVHFDMAVKELNIDKGLEKKILDEYMDFLQPSQSQDKKEEVNK